MFDGNKHSTDNDKEGLLADYLRNEAIDIVRATEIWLTNQDRDVIWIESNELVKDSYHISTVYRDSRKGGISSNIQ